MYIQFNRSDPKFYFLNHGNFFQSVNSFVWFYFISNNNILMPLNSLGFVQKIWNEKQFLFRRKMINLLMMNDITGTSSLLSQAQRQHNLNTAVGLDIKMTLHTTTTTHHHHKNSASVFMNLRRTFIDHNLMSCDQ